MNLQWNIGRLMGGLLDIIMDARVRTLCFVLMIVGAVGGSYYGYAHHSGFSYAVDFATIPAAIFIASLLLDSDSEDDIAPFFGVVFTILAGVMAAAGGFAGGVAHLQGRWLWLTLCGVFVLYMLVMWFFDINARRKSTRLATLMLIGALASLISSGVSYGANDMSFAISLVAIAVSFLLLLLVATAKRPVTVSAPAVSRYR